MKVRGDEACHGWVSSNQCAFVRSYVLYSDVNVCVWVCVPGLASPHMLGTGMVSVRLCDSGVTPSSLPHHRALIAMPSGLLAA